MTAKKRILVIDSDRDACELIAKVLGPRGFEVFPFSDPDEGVAKAGEIRPDLVFISILFPGSNGLKISRTVHSVDGLQGVPVIMLLSYSDELDPKYTSTIGIVDVALKPLSPEEILSKTVSVLGEGIEPDGTEEIRPGSTVVTETEAASLDEEWMSFLDKDDEGSVAPEAPLTREPEQDSYGLVHEEGEAAGGWEDERAAGFSGVTRGGTGEAAEGRVEEVHEAGDDISSEDAGDSLSAREQERPVPSAEDESPEFCAAPQGRSMKKFLGIVAALSVIVIGAGVGAYLFFQGQGGKTVTPVTKAPLKKAPAVEAKQNTAPAEKPAVPAQIPAGEKTTTTVPSAPKNAAGKKAAAVTAKAKKESYSVQVGAFHDEKNAAALIVKLKKKGYNAFVLNDAGGRVHRVLIGKFDSGGAAAVEAKRVLEREGMKSIIFRY